MRILVCVKQVPDAAEVRLNEDFTIQREGAAHRMNPADESALELGLSLRDTHGGRVTVLTMGPAQAAGDVYKRQFLYASNRCLRPTRWKSTKRPGC